MTDPERLGRREFTLQAALALLSGATITVAACGGSGGYGGGPAGAVTGPGTGPPPSPAPSPPPSGRDLTGAISANHGHLAVITSAQLSAGGRLRLEIQGQADHPHSVELTADDLASLKGGGNVAKKSSVTATGSAGTHDHDVTFSGSGNPPDDDDDDDGY